MSTPGGNGIAPAGVQGISFPGAPPAFESKMQRLRYVATRISVAAARFCGENVTTVTIAGKQLFACNYQWAVVDTNAVNAAADGRNIYVFSSLLDIVDSDDELAFVLGHELAHNVMRHHDKRTNNAVVGAVVGVALSGIVGYDVTRSAASFGGRMYSKQFEAEADYVGTYFTALAGYDYRNTASFMRRMGARSPASISHGESHPPTAERFVAIQAAADEVAGKLSRGEPLVPNGIENMKGDIAVLAVTPGTAPIIGLLAAQEIVPAGAAGSAFWPPRLEEKEQRQEDGSKPVDCVASGISFGYRNSFKCRRHPDDAAPKGTGAFRRTDILGTFGGTDQYFLSARFEQPAGGSGRVRPAADPADVIRTFGDRIGQISDWSPLHKAGSASTMKFTRKRVQCVGFYKLDDGDPGYQASGFVCARKGAVDEAILEDILSAFTVAAAT